MALDYEQAVTVAKAFLAAEPFPYPEYRYALTIGQPTAGGWYFDYSIERIDGQPMSEREAFGGAPGYLVPSDGSKVRVISWEEWSDRQLGGK